MSQLKSHQLLHRQRERSIIAERLLKAEAELNAFEKDRPDDPAAAMHIEGLIKAEIRRCLELYAVLDKRVARLT